MKTLFKRRLLKRINNRSRSSKTLKFTADIGFRRPNEVSLPPLSLSVPACSRTRESHEFEIRQPSSSINPLKHSFYAKRSQYAMRYQLDLPRPHHPFKFSKITICVIAYLVVRLLAGYLYYNNVINKFAL